MDPNLATTWVNRGNALLQMGNDGDPEQAEADFTKAIELAPDAATVYYNRALVRSEAGEWELSNADLVAAQERDSRNPTINNTLCWQLGVQRQPEAALPYCNLALGREPDGPARDTGIEKKHAVYLSDHNNVVRDLAECAPDDWTLVQAARHHIAGSESLDQTYNSCLGQEILATFERETHHHLRRPLSKRPGAIVPSSGQTLRRCFPITGWRPEKQPITTVAPLWPLW